MFTRLLAVAGLIFPAMTFAPATSFACDYSDRYECKDDIRQLVAYRSEAIEYAFGDVFGALPRQVAIKFVRSSDEEYARFSGRVAYDVSQRAVIVPAAFLSAQMPLPLKWASSYWPYYRNVRYQQAFPLIAAIDNALWGAVLQETARQKNLSWPHEGCKSVDMAKRLPCEMMISGVASLLTSNQSAMFNENRMERIWPESFSSFQRQSLRSERDYGDVRRFGGILLLKPLFSEFGVGSALTYVAQTPFVIEDDNLRVSALRYQERAREALQNSKEHMLVSDDTRADDGTAIVMPVRREPRFVSFGRRDGV